MHMRKVNREKRYLDKLRLKHGAEAWGTKIEDHIEVETRINRFYCCSPVSFGAIRILRYRNWPIKNLAGPNSLGLPLSMRLSIV